MTIHLEARGQCSNRVQIFVRVLHHWITLPGSQDALAQVVFGVFIGGDKTLRVLLKVNAAAHDVDTLFGIDQAGNIYGMGKAVEQLRAQVTFFRLGEDPGLARFVDSMAARAGGRVVAPELEDLGVAVVDSYLGSRGPFGGTSYREWFGGRGWWAD